MARTRTVFDVLYDDGTEEQFPLTPRGTVEAERKFKTLSSYEASCYSAWVSKGKPGSFEQFLSSLVDLETKVLEAEDPLAPEPPPAT